MEDLAVSLRAHQEAHETLGGLYRALHTFADRLIERFFSDVEMPQIVLSMEKTRRNRLGHYRPSDGYLLVHTINLNIYTMKTGLQAASTLAHELVHAWQVMDGHPCEKNYHGTDFHEKMAELGIETVGPRGMHKRETDAWLNWMEENSDLKLDKFLMPGINQRARRQLNLFHCECDGGNPIRSRKWLDVTCNECGQEYQYVPTSARSRSRPSAG